MGTPLRADLWLNDHKMLDEVLANEAFAKAVAQNGDVIRRRGMHSPFFRYHEWTI